MITAKLDTILLAGANPQQPEQYQSIRFSNVLSLVACCVILLQLPVQLLIWSAQSPVQILLILSHAILMTSVPLLNRANRYCAARLVLILLYSSYIGLSSFNFGFLTPIHYFFLIAIFAIPFLHFDLTTKEVVYMMLWFLLAYLFWETALVNNHLDEDAGVAAAILSKSDKLSFGISCFLTGYFIYVSLKSSWKTIRKEQFKTNMLLLNILPKEVALRLNQEEKPIADHFDNVTILFADIQGFSTLAKRYSPGELVSLLNQLFCRFDRLVAKYGLEKIKTIGDQYMAVAGLPVYQEKHAINTCKCAIRMQEEFIIWTRENNLSNTLRIGINSGPVVAGVIGMHKFSYDLWGEAVNLASRMESQGYAGKIQVSEATYDLVKGQFMFDYQDTIEVKGMGPQNVYWINEPYSV